MWRDATSWVLELLGRACLPVLQGRNKECGAEDRTANYRDQKSGVDSDWGRCSCASAQEDEVNATHDVDKAGHIDERWNRPPEEPRVPWSEGAEYMIPLDFALFWEPAEQEMWPHCDEQTNETSREVEPPQHCEFPKASEGSRALKDEKEGGDGEDHSIGSPHEELPLAA